MSIRPSNPIDKRTASEINNKTDAEFIVFYGTLMEDFGALKDLNIEPGLAYIASCQFEGAIYDLGEYPGLIVENGESGKVCGELFEIIDSAVLDVLDDYEGYYPEDPEGSLYIRTPIKLLNPPKHTGLEAWVYVYNRSTAGQYRIPSGNWKAR